MMKANILLLITAAIWGSAFVAQRVGMDYIGPFTFSGIRFLIGSAVLVPLAIWLNYRLKNKVSNDAPVKSNQGSEQKGALGHGASNQKPIRHHHVKGRIAERG